jgi:hypothetical protein
MQEQDQTDWVILPTGETRKVLPLGDSVIKVEKCDGGENLFALVYSDVEGTHRVYLPVARQPELIERYSISDYRDYPGAWYWQEFNVYDAGEMNVTICFADGRYGPGVTSTVEVETVRQARAHSAYSSDFEPPSIHDSNSSRSKERPQPQGGGGFSTMVEHSAAIITLL